MASSKVMASRSPPNPDLTRQPSPPPLTLHSGHSRGFGSTNMDDYYYRNMYTESDSFALESNGGGGSGDGVGVRSSAIDGGGGGGGEMRSGDANRVVTGGWRDFMSGAGGGAPNNTAMVLDDLIAKARAANEEDIGVLAMATRSAPPPPPPAVGGAFGIESVMMNPAAQSASAACVRNGFGVEFGSGMAAVSGGAGGKGKRRAAVEEAPLDKATQQKQRRMIKNRESAARSRERKQAYTVELESLVAQLEEDNAGLLKEEAELNRERYTQLMENVIPVTEKRRPKKVLRRVLSI
ncbi:hypothetical protein ABFS83_14G092600 [Erythranthe nasuta]